MTESVVGESSGRIDLRCGTSVFYGARWKFVLAFLGSVGFVAACAAMLAYAPLHTVKGVFLWVGVAFFSTCGAVALIRLCIDAPTLIITRQQVCTTSLWGRSRPGVLIDDIEHVVVWKMSHNLYVGVVLRREAIERRTAAAARTAVLNQKLLGVPAALAVAQMSLRSPVDEVAEEIASRCGCPVIDMRNPRP